MTIKKSTGQRRVLKGSVYTKFERQFAAIRKRANSFASKIDSLIDDIREVAYSNDAVDEEIAEGRKVVKDLTRQLAHATSAFNVVAQTNENLALENADLKKELEALKSFYRQIIGKGDRPCGQSKKKSR